MIKIKLKSYSDPLEEGRVDDMKKKYPGKDDLVDQFAKAPGNNKYLDWMLRHHEETSPDEMLAAIEKFDKYISQVKQKDINSYKNFEALQDTVEDLRPPKKELERKGSQGLYDDEEFSITRPTNKEAACKLGAGTKWCISATKSNNYFGRYAKGGAYHYFLKIKNLSSEDPKHHVAYTLIQSKGKKPSVEIYDAEDRLIDRRAVVYAIETASDENNAEQKEEKLFQAMLADFEKQTPSDAGDPFDELYDELEYRASDEYDNINRSDSISAKIYEIFFDFETDSFRSDPRFVKKQIRKLIGMNNEYIDNYLLNIFNNTNVNNVTARAINANIAPEQKSEVLKRTQERKRKEEDYHNQKVNELVGVMVEPKYKSVLDLVNKGYEIGIIYRFFQGLFPTYTEKEIKDATDIALEKNKKQEESTNESKLFKFNKDKKMFKLLR